ncbi:MAG TPA: AIR synthase-related protein, partial [Chitinophagaceae bacterium]
QVGDPFQEKKLLEACLEVIQTGVVVGMQDMGAAGIICSTSEMSAKGEVGMRIDLDKVPTRQKNMKAWELLLSESQERMLMVVEKGKEKKVLDVFEKWDLPCAEIGEVTGDGILRFYMHGELEAEIPAYELVLGGGAPQYDRSFREPAYFEKIKAFNADAIKVPGNLQQVAQQIIQIPNIASKKWIYVQYDSMVGTANTSTNEPSDAAIVLGKPSEKALAVTVDCNSRYVFADPYKGAMISVAEAARNIVCSGGEPLGVTNCLNFGNPYDPEVYYQFTQAIKGMGDACRKFNTPVTGGNVSFYNQSPDGPVYPTPTIGMVGLLEDVRDKMTLDYKEAGDVIFMIGKNSNDIHSSEYLHKVHGVQFSPAPHFDLEEEFVLQQKLSALIKSGVIVSAHDISEGGVFIALTESGFNRELGYDITTNKSVRKDAFLFGEAQSRVIVTVKKDQVASFKKQMGDHPYEQLGTVTDGDVIVDGEHWDNINEWKSRYDNAIGRELAGHESEEALVTI